MKTIIFGNGAISKINSKEKTIYKNTGYFLKNLLDNDYNYIYSDLEIETNKNKELSDFNLVEHRIPLYTISKKQSIFIQIFKLFKLISENDFFYLFFPGKVSSLAVLFIILFRKKYALYLRGEVLKYKYLSNLIIKKATFVLTVSPFFTKKYKNKSFSTIRPMISFSLEDIVLKQIKIEENKPISFLFVGRVEKAKGILELLDICKYLERKNIHYVLNVVGVGELYSNLTKKQKEGFISNKIHFLGLVTDKVHLKNIYLNSSILILPTHNEGFPRVLYEAMIFNLPIFTTFVGGISGRMKDQYNCIEIPVNNAEKASEIIYKSIRNVSLLEKIGLNAQKDIKTILEQEKEHYQLLIEKTNEFIK